MKAFRTLFLFVFCLSVVGVAFVASPALSARAETLTEKYVDLGVGKDIGADDQGDKAYNNMCFALLVSRNDISFNPLNEDYMFIKKNVSRDFKEFGIYNFLFTYSTLRGNVGVFCPVKVYFKKGTYPFATYSEVYECKFVPQSKVKISEDSYMRLSESTDITCTVSIGLNGKYYALENRLALSSRYAIPFILSEGEVSNNSGGNSGEVEDPNGSINGSSSGSLDNENNPDNIIEEGKINSLVDFLKFITAKGTHIVYKTLFWCIVFFVLILVLYVIFTLTSFVLRGKK